MHSPVETLRQSAHLFDTLLHRAFRGELGGVDREVAVELAEQLEPASELAQMGMELE